MSQEDKARLPFANMEARNPAATSPIKANEPNDVLSARLVDAIHHRQSNGEATTLRDLHRLLDVVQPVALRLAYRLQDAGVAEIESDATDAFAAKIIIVTTA